MEGDERLDRLLREAYPMQEVSPDFTLRLWRRMMKGPARPPWMLPVPVAAMAAVVGIASGVWSWREGLPEAHRPAAGLNAVARLDLFGNAPLDSVAGGYLALIGEGGESG